MNGQASERALIAYCRNRLGTIAEIATQSQAWRSATFDGLQIELTFSTSDDRLDDFLADAPEADIPVAGGFVADLAADAVSGTPGKARVTVVALIIADA